MQRTKHEVLDHFIVFGEQHLRYLISSWLDYYHHHRPHQGLGNELLTRSGSPPEPVEHIPLSEVVCHTRLGGLLRHYEQKAA